MNYRQGDIILLAVKKLPLNTRETKDKVLAQGEATGHCHTLIGEVKVYNVISEAQTVLTKYVEVLENATLTHPEHGTQVIEKGIYEVRQPREYVPGGWRQVTD